MGFRLIYDDWEAQLELPFEGHIEDQLILAISDEPHNDAARRALAHRIVDLLTSLMEGVALPPSAKQIKYAIAIARELSVELPDQALQYRVNMSAFLGRYAEIYRRKRASTRTSSVSQTAS